MSDLIPVAIAVPLAAAALALVAWGRVAIQRVISVVASVVSMGVAVAMLVAVDRDGPTSVIMGGWDGPVGIELLGDRLSVLLLVTSSVALLGVLGFAIGQRGTDDAIPAFHAVYQVLAAGVALSLLTADIFTLFVGFEVMLTASYVLITVRTGPGQIWATMTYVVVGLVASLLFLTTIAFLYAATGTVNMAQIAERLVDVPVGTRTALGALLFMVLGIKAAIFPLFNWLPDSYPTATTAVTAVFAGLLTKVGVYAILRTQVTMFDHQGPSTLVLVIAGFTMVVGVLGAISQSDVKRILSFHVVSQIGYMIMGIGLFSIAGIAGAIVFLVHQILVKTTMFLVGGLVESSAGTGDLDTVDGLAHVRPWVAVWFGVGALSLAGLPPTSGFVGKLALIDAGLSAGQWTIVGVSLFASLLTLYSMVKIWSATFWGEPTDNITGRPGALMFTATGAMALVAVGVAFAGEHLVAFATRAAVDLVGGGIP